MQLIKILGLWLLAAVVAYVLGYVLGFAWGKVLTDG